MRRRVFALCVAAAAWALADAALAGVAVEGLDRARLLVPAGAAVEAYANAGYRIAVRDDEILVEVETSPLASAAPFLPPPARAGEEPVARLARALTTGVATQYEAVSRVLGWVSRSVRYELDRNSPQEPEQVLRRRSGYCTGVARLSVALLAAVGIEAREVAGWVAERSGPAHGYHRWIEVRYPDRGWVFSDPLTTHHYVPATYVRLASEQVAASGRGLVLERDDRTAAVDVYAAGAQGTRARRNSPRQLAASLRVVTGGDRAGVAVLEGGGLRRTLRLAAGDGVFVGLEPGRYRLELRLGGERVERRLLIPAVERRTLFLGGPV